MSSIQLSISRELSAAEAEKVRKAEDFLTGEWFRFDFHKKGTWIDFYQKKARPLALNKLFEELSHVDVIAMERTDGVWVTRKGNQSFVHDIHRHFEKVLAILRHNECRDFYAFGKLRHKGREKPSTVAFNATVYQGLNREELDYVKAHPDEFKHYWEMVGD